MLDVTLIRHGEVEPQWKSICYGAMDVPLSPAGQAAGQTLAAAIGQQSRADFVFHSGLSRTASLAKMIAVHFPSARVIEDDRLRERDYGDWQGATWDRVYHSDPENFNGLVDDPDNYRPPGGETTTEMQSRVVQWFGDLGRIDHATKVIAVSHSGPIAALAGYCHNLHASEWQPWMLKNLEAIQLLSDRSAAADTWLPPRCRRVF
ncbi:histidine phosphatase family protein [Allorhodopirellula heiligendammensis]|uniref:Phosphoserine phosphatase 1 n=1 Tax=Allorhodopirellula heiligendammensis TaxID=2714739 RepID=A0A5C6BUG2_9BACT|nr:histidine phosphatase family protein [Allorhodopirellula heiligendammensis]TWU15287.1 Phosphoserine phosphatase 1 [Allorhodopirellula heiligendammensis]